ncbi:MAG TPA: type IV toxin-antitoxin system AbiEi family antitoxin domain-containing protein [Acidimicrobiales bacterium]|nr:type IV toxin-antitoxin system AbiEi family antitoxin domain-containing protein [Acidimicrobiales bacterium]
MVAAAQQGLFTRSQALGAGLTAKELEGGARSGAWPRVHRGVYRMAGAPATDLQRLLAAVLACGPGALASHVAAAWVWEMADSLALHVTRAGRGRPSGVLVHWTREEPRPVLRRGVPCTNPLRTVWTSPPWVTAAR